MPSVAVIGSTGMLGRAVAGAKFVGREVIELNRSNKAVWESNRHVQIDSDITDLEYKIDLHDVDFIVNCVGLIRQKINEKDPNSVSAAMYANSTIPKILVTLSEKYDFKILQIGTDCVFSGVKGNYIETDSHDALDIYGKSKSLGEISHDNLSIIRSSIVGKEASSNNSLMSWLISRPNGALVNGFNDQIWNGVTTFHFARLISGIIDSGKFENFVGAHHFVPSDKVSKETLLRYIASAFNRDDLEIKSIASGHKLDMTLSTNNSILNNYLWKLAGYAEPLSIQAMIVEYSDVIKLGGEPWQQTTSKGQPS